MSFRRAHQLPDDFLDEIESGDLDFGIALLDYTVGYLEATRGRESTITLLRGSLESIERETRTVN
jgi:hypothetical protein